MADLCEGSLTPEYWPLVNTSKWIRSNFSPDGYRQRFDIPFPFSHYPDPSVLTAYLEHYQNQRTCKDMLSSMLPCLCIYPPIAAQLFSTLYFTHNPDGSLLKPKASDLPLTVYRWLSDNALESGRACNLLQSALETAFGGISPDPYNKSMFLELEFWSVSRN
eukprot:TRINITY_DN5679_c0_g2_i1.p1 TRINITY_DN5679_c0_g2~~TRINITY_DN5679_c0_g2_i1.p1  ORF type:complete len:182 (+),score=29.56 TRINITY_DN5679_c0_g2_i1:63-548(+)